MRCSLLLGILHTVCFMSETLYFLVGCFVLLDVTLQGQGPEGTLYGIRH